METKIFFSLCGQLLTHTGGAIPLAASKNLYTAVFTFDSAWSGLTAYAQFMLGDTVISNTPVIDGSCTVPNAVYAQPGSFSVSVYASDRITTNAVTVTVAVSGYSSADPEEITAEDGYSYVQTPDDGTELSLIRINNGVLQRYTDNAWTDIVMDGRYYTEAEINVLLETKSELSHTHDGRYYTEAEINALLSAKQKKAVTASAVLTTGGWSSLVQTVAVSGVAASSIVIVSSDDSAWAENGVKCTAQASGTLTFTCASKPSSAIAVKAVIL